MNELKLLKNSPVDFIVYQPSVLPDGVSKDELRTESKTEVRQLLYKSGGRYGIIYQTKVGSGLHTNGDCDDCRTLAQTIGGNSINTAYVAGSNITKWGFTNGDTRIVVVIYGQQQNDGITDSNIVGLFNSLLRAN